MTSGYVVVLDACVLVNAALRDTLLRIAEESLYRARWSEQIIAEVESTLIHKLHLDAGKVAYLIGQLREHFEDCWVTNYERLIPQMTNHAKDRHVLAAAVRSGAHRIVTFNLRDFPAASLADTDIEVQHPDDFLLLQLDLDEETVRRVIQEQSKIFADRERLLNILSSTCPKFVHRLRAGQ